MKQINRYLHLVLACLITVAVYATEQDRTFRVINASSDLADNSAQLVACNELGRIIISTIGNINFYDGESFRHIDTRQDLQYPLPAYNGKYRFYFDDAYHIWLKNTGSVTCVNLLTELFVNNVDSLLYTMGNIEPAQDLFVDSTGCVWLLNSRGLQNMNLQRNYGVPTEHNLQDLEVIDGQLVLFYEDGSEVGIDLVTGKRTHITRAYDSASAAKYAKSSYIVRYGDGVFQIRNGEKESILLYFDVQHLTWTTIVEESYLMNSLCVQDNKLYIPSEIGYAVYDLRTKEMEYVNTLTLSSGKQLTATCCNDIVFDRQGGMWIGTENRGMLYSSLPESPFKIYAWGTPMANQYAAVVDSIQQVEVPQLDGLQTNCCYIDSRGWQWVGTTAGLYLYKTPESEPIIFSTRNGFYNNVVHSVTEGIQHNIWVATSGGISCVLFDGEEFDFINTFSVEDNVPYESFINGKAYCVDSLIMMQSLDHVIVFNPQHLDYANKRRPFKLYPRLIRLMVDGNDIGPNQILDDIRIIDKAVNRCHTINLASNHTNISLLFTALNYYRPRQTYYRVHFEGNGRDEWKEFSYSDEQNKIDNKGLLHYPLYGLEPGDYKLTVQASMFPGMYDDEEFTWHIHVNEPWWRSMSLYLFFGVVIAILTIYNLIHFTRNTRMKMHRNNEEGDVISKISSFVERYEEVASELLMPTQEEFQSGMKKSNIQLSQEFINVMNKLIPYVHEHKQSGFSMHELSKVANLDLQHLYEVITPHIHKSPRDMFLSNCLQKASDLLSTTEKSVGEIATECDFYTPNYMIGAFFHQYKQTPEEYRNKKKQQGKHNQSTHI